MKVFYSIDDFISENHATTVTMGSFDGVHKGHQWVLNTLKQTAAQTGTKPVVLSFSPHPRLFFEPDSNFKLLTTDSEKTNLLAKQDINTFILQKFDSNFASLSAENLIAKLSEKLQMKNLLIGYDHHFGKNREGNLTFIQSLEKKYRFKTIALDVFKIDGLEISSSLIRNLLSQGNIQKANKFLGYTYFIQGAVVTGFKLGRKIGYPTANIEVENKHKLIPAHGVYVVQSVWDGKKIYGMMNIGIRPTIGGKKLSLEVHFFDFNQDIYGKKLSIHFIQRLRDEIKFDSLEQLKLQLHKDENTARQVILDFRN